MLSSSSSQTLVSQPYEDMVDTLRSHTVAQPTKNPIIRATFRSHNRRVGTAANGKPHCQLHIPVQ
jgi:hypothetical protein